MKKMQMMLAQSPVGFCLCAVLALFLVSQADGVALAKPIDSIEDAINSAPIRDLRKLQATATATAALPEINKYYGQHVLNQKAVIKAKVEFADVTSPGRNDLRIRAVPMTVNPKGMSKPVPVLNWFYFGEGAPAPATIVAGSEITVSGIIRRCEVVRTEDGFLRVNFDLVQSKLEK